MNFTPSMHLFPMKKKKSPFSLQPHTQTEYHKIRLKGGIYWLLSADQWVVTH